jgi:hypothetical protein
VFGWAIFSIFTKVFMKRRKALRPLIYLFAVVLMAMVTESCKSSRHCGCHGDINGSYKPRKMRY